MIGQEHLLKIIDHQIQEGTFPRFSIITGLRGSGKKTLSQYIINSFPNEYCKYWLPDIKVETIRKMISDSYKLTVDTIYVIPDADKMSVAAKNALLKVCEEPPNKAMFIMTVSDSNLVLDTIRSRASIYYMQPYTPKQITEYFNEVCGVKDIRKTNIVLDLCETPGDVLLLMDQGIEQLYDYVEKVVDNIAEVSEANAFKIDTKLSLKEGSDGYDVELFLRAFRSVCGKEMQKAATEGDKEATNWYLEGIKAVNNSLSHLKIPGINKDALFTIFILNIREVWQ